MLEDVRRYMRLGLEALSSQGPDDAGGGNVRTRAQVVAEQLTTLAAGFLDWSGEAKTSLLKEIRELVAGQVQEMGVATKKDVERLQARLERLEGRLAPAPEKRRVVSAAGRATSSKASAKGRAKAKARSAGRDRRAARATSRSGVARGPR